LILSVEFRAWIAGLTKPGDGRESMLIGTIIWGIAALSVK
jgi:hypothetical protein